MHQIAHQAVSRREILDLPIPIPAERMSELVSFLVLKLAGDLNVEGIVPGHIKAMVRDEDDFAIFSATKLGKVEQQGSPRWSEVLLPRLELSLEVIVDDLPREIIIAQVDKYWEEFLDSLIRE